MAANIDELVKKMQLFVGISKEIGASMDRLLPGLTRLPNGYFIQPTPIEAYVHTARDWIQEAEETVDRILVKIDERRCSASSDEN